MPRVSLFVTCIVDQVFPQVGLAMAGVLDRAGCEIEFREAQTCCGQPAFNSGYRREARTVAEYFLQVFEDADYIVVEMAKHILGENWLPEFVARANQGGVERVLL